MRVLVTGSGNITGLNVIKALIGSNHYFVGCDIHDYNPADKYCRNYVVPVCSSHTYIQEIISIIEGEKINAIIPSNDHELRKLAENIDVFESLGVVINGFSTYTIDFLDKDRTTDLFEKNQIKTPRKYNEIKIPCVVRKKEVGNKQKYVYILKSEDDVNSDVSTLSDSVITEYIQGEEYTIDVLLNQFSSVLSCTPRLRRIVENGMVHLAELVNDTLVIEGAIELSERLKLKGMNCIQCIKNEQGCYFFEVNARPGSGMDITVAGGNNYPVLWLDTLESKNVEIKEINWGLKMLRISDAYFFK